MKQFTLKLEENYQRPIVVLENGLTALLDTGACLPVWTDDELLLKERFAAELVRENFSFSGFGGIAHGNLYRVDFVMGEFVFPRMAIVACNEFETTYNLLLSAPMFEGLVYQIDTVNRALNIDVPNTESVIRNIKIQNSSGKWFILSGEVSSPQVSGLAIF